MPPRHTSHIFQSNDPNIAQNTRVVLGKNGKPCAVREVNRSRTNDVLCYCPYTGKIIPSNQPFVNPDKKNKKKGKKGKKRR